MYIQCIYKEYPLDSEFISRCLIAFCGSIIPCLLIYLYFYVLSSFFRKKCFFNIYTKVENSKGIEKDTGKRSLVTPDVWPPYSPFQRKPLLSVPEVLFCEESMLIQIYLHMYIQVKMCS